MKDKTNQLDKKTKKLNSRFVRVIPSTSYAGFMADVRREKDHFYKYDGKGRRVL